jgi:2-polyprenyl-6-methoxyphenol hydroxylase-like FAD-dependent oxidoreductase
MKVVICGAGIAGLSLALCLAQRGHAPLVIEQAPELRDEGYMVDFCGHGFDVASRLDILSELAKIHYHVKDLVFVDEKGDERVSVPYGVLRHRLFGGRHFNVMRGDLERLLFDRLRDLVDIRFGTTLTHFEQRRDEIGVGLSDGTAGDFDVLVGADGVHSMVRQMAFGPDEHFTRFLGCYSLAFILQRTPQGLRRDAFVTMSMPGRQVAVHPLRGGRLAVLFVYRIDRPVEEFGRDAALGELRKAFGSAGWFVPELLARAEEAPDVHFEAVTQIEMPSWSANRVVLLGDACQCASLLDGQGASRAHAAAYVLAHEFDGNPKDIYAALLKYERRLKPSVGKKRAAGRKIANWLVPSSAWRLSVRDLSLRMSVWPLASSVVRNSTISESIFKG